MRSHETMAGGLPKKVSQRLFLFDFDGVLVDSLGLYERSVNLCLERIGQRPIDTREEFLYLFEENFYSAIVKCGVDTAEFIQYYNAMPI